MDLLEIEGLNKSFGGLRAIRNVDLSVQEGAIVGLIGPNGSGKTTMLNLITGFLRPTSGRVIFNGKDITTPPTRRELLEAATRGRFLTGPAPNKACKAGIARTFQLTKAFLEFTALENVMVGRAYGQSPAKNLKVAAREAAESLAQVGLQDKGHVCARDLTLMQRKRLELARALAARPRLLLLDELMAGLNPGEAEDAMALIRSIRDSGISIIVVEHIVKAIMGLSDRVVVLNMGEKIAEGTPDEIRSNPQVIDVYLGKAHASN
jgi:branched-chain amino acid transport system ATP-binding protein